MGGRPLTWHAAAVLLAAVMAVQAAHGDVPDVPVLYDGPVDGSPAKESDSGNGCTVWADHDYGWSPLDPPRNNAPHEESLYTWDIVPGAYTYGGDGCCRITTDGPNPNGGWSELLDRSYAVLAGRKTGHDYQSHVDGSGNRYWAYNNMPSNGVPYVQQMKISDSGKPTPNSTVAGGYIHTAEYDNAGRSRTHWQGTEEGHGLTGGAVFTVKGYTFDNSKPPKCVVLSATVHSKADFRYRNPFWNTTIHEHHILDAQGYPASNLDYSQYRYDAIPLEAGSNLVLGGYRWETIRITHELDGGAAAEFHCGDKTCRIDLPATDASRRYIGNMQYGGDARNPPWAAPGPGVEHQLDDGEAFFSAAASRSGEKHIIATMWNLDREVAKGYNATYQFVPSYEPIMSVTPVTNTALGGDHNLDRPVSAIIQYNGTGSDTLHYCAAGDAHFVNGTVIPYGKLGGADAWGRVAGDDCPEGAGQEWGVEPEHCARTHCETYTVHPDEPAASGWGRWSAVNPETRALLDGFHGNHTVCDGAECAVSPTPYINWDYVPGTDRDFIPACVAEDIAAEGEGLGDWVNKPKPANWGMDGKWWPSGEYEMDEKTMEPHSYRGLFAAWPESVATGIAKPPAHYVVNSDHCEAEAGERECVPRGAECRPEYDRRCEDVFTPLLYPDDYIRSGHKKMQDIVLGWCGESPTDTCTADAYEVIDEVMVSACESAGVVYGGRSQVIDAYALFDDGGMTAARCHNGFMAGEFVPNLNGAVDDWRDCYTGTQRQSTNPTAAGVTGETGVWPNGKPDGDPQCGLGLNLEFIPSEPRWDGRTQNVYVPYTPTTGAFSGVVERPGRMLLDDGSLTCACDDGNGNGICDYAESGTDLDGNGRADNWDSLTMDGAVKCLDRTGKKATALTACWTKYGRDAVSGANDDLRACLDAADGVEDGPDGECNPALILGAVMPDGTVDTTNLPDGWMGRAADAASGLMMSVQFRQFDGLIPIPYVVDGQHMHCDESEAWCLSSGDTYEEHDRREVCEDPDMPVSVKRVPAPSTMPPLYQPAFDERWPPECLPEYPVAEWQRPAHGVSLDLENVKSEWPTKPPEYGGMSKQYTPAHVSTDDDPGAGSNHTMFVHAGSGVIRFGPCEGCSPTLSGDTWWTGNISSTLGGATHTANSTMQHPPHIISQEGTARVVAVEPCEDCPGGWQPSVRSPGVRLVLTAYPEMKNPVTNRAEMAAAACQIDGDRGTGFLNPIATWFGGSVMQPLVDFWNELTCRDIPGISLTIQDYEAAKHGIAAKRESGQPWTVAEGGNDVSVMVLRNGIWLSTMSILEHRGQCTTYSWSQGVTPGHTGCPATAQELQDCMYGGGTLGECFDRVEGSMTAALAGACADVYTEDGIHKKWEFKAGGTPDVIYRMPDGSYAGDGFAAVPDEVGNMKWTGIGKELLRCEVAVGIADAGDEAAGAAGPEYVVYGVEHGIPAAEIDISRGGSYACQDVQACKTESVVYKCMGGEAVPHKVCTDLADTFSVMDMPYEEVLANVGAQKLHIEASCPPEHGLSGLNPMCDGRQIYDTHTLSDAADSTLIYVDFFGSGILGVSRADRYTDTVHVRAPETFGNIHKIVVGDGAAARNIELGAPCTTCAFEHAGAGRITAWNLYGAQLSADIDGSLLPVLTNIGMDDVQGALWLYLPILIMAAGVYVVVWKIKKHFDIWDSDGGNVSPYP